MAIAVTEIQVLDNETLAQVFVSGQPMRVGVKEDKRVTKFTVESGETKNDHIVNEPIEISIDFIVTDEDAKNQLEQMRSMFRDNKLFTVQCKMGSYPNMLIQSFPHDETAQLYDGASVPLSFIEWRETTPEYGTLKQEAVRNPQHSSTVSRGKQTGSEPSEAQEERGSSILGRWAK
jgi:hypothetical protein